MNKVFRALVVSLSLVIFGHGLAHAEKAVAVLQPDAPLEIFLYENDFDTKDSKPRIRHLVKYQNVSKQKVLSARFGFVECNDYNELVGSFVGYSLEDAKVGEKNKIKFTDEAPYASFFKKYGSSFVWVDAVRFENGTVWNADRSHVVIDLKSYLPGIKEIDLAEKKSLMED
ncbi:hypothetical protein L4X63_03000 [Geomonas sp. Red32]|uniref:hypothetical protein n=1 Tax=Geomonas sp. Red32 TaxID=2912856 RepID=UPI00202CD6E9|nr:hypothetical protein [Geomonas sp. Red32]MCM0080550.1 hypothetical protein [Geomonas sp. Red32]